MLRLPCSVGRTVLRFCKSPTVPSLAPKLPTARILNAITAARQYNWLQNGRHFSTSATTPYSDIYIRYASQGGTAQLFAQQLYECLDETVTPDVQSSSQDTQPQLHLEAWNEIDPAVFFENSQALYLLLTSTAGIGEPPENGRQFYEWLMQQPTISSLNSSAHNSKIDFALFGLGNQLAHPNHYNLCSKNVYSKLLELGLFRPILPLTLGDDGGCLDDDFDTWQQQVLEYVLAPKTTDLRMQVTEHNDDKQTNETLSSNSSTSSRTTSTTSTSTDLSVSTIECPGAKVDGRRLATSNAKKYPTLRLERSTTQHVRSDLLDVAPSLYSPGTQRMTVLSQHSLNTDDPTAAALHELRLAFSSETNAENSHVPNYQAGDHVILMPRNAEYIVQAVIDLLDVDPHAIIQGQIDSGLSTQYPFPTGLSVFETLSHCVDLTAPPSPSFARLLLNRDDLNYKADIAGPRRTVLDLLLERKSQGQTMLSLEDLLYNLSPLHGRHYSIASSPLAHADSLLLTFRPVQYVSSRGNRLQGVCTSYMTGLTTGSRALVSIQTNPSFRLPTDPSVPVIFVAGGCGVAPIRAFLEERLTQNIDLTNTFIFLGFRNPADQVYGELVQRAVDAGAVAHVTYSTGCAHQNCGHVTNALRHQARLVYQLLNQGAHIYLCGGARTFGVAVENELHQLVQNEQGCTEEAATRYLRDLAKEGRLHEDLAD